MDSACQFNFVLDDTRDKPFFSLMLSTPRLLDGTHLWRPVEMDETYKLMYEGFPLTVMGQSDANRVFHTRAVGISTLSTEEVGNFYLSTWSNRVPDFQPVAYLGDGANAFANAAKRVFPSVGTHGVRLMCFAHVYKVKTRHRSFSNAFHGLKVHFIRHEK